MLSYPLHVETISAKPGLAWSQKERTAVIVWLNVPPQRGRLIGFARKYVGAHAEDAWEEFQIEELHRTISTYDPSRGPLDRWLLLRLGQFSIRQIRAARRRPEAPIARESNVPGEVIELDILDSNAQTELTIVNRLDLQRLRPALENCLNALPKQYLDVIVMRFFEDKSDRDISQELGISEGNVRALRFRGMRHLQGCLPRP
jgi:RNA polymerase sigma factor (sigma-70 family)